MGGKWKDPVSFLPFSSYEAKLTENRYVATVDGIFEFHLNIHDRKTFPIVSFR